MLARTAARNCRLSPAAEVRDQPGDQPVVARRRFAYGLETQPSCGGGDPRMRRKTRRGGERIEGAPGHRGQVTHTFAAGDGKGMELATLTGVG